MSEQLSLLPLRDPREPRVGRYHSHGQETERLAAVLVMPRAGTQRARYVTWLEICGEHGSTDCEACLEGGVGARPHVAGTRREELIVDGWPIKDSGRRRDTDTGTPAIVWVLEEQT